MITTEIMRDILTRLFGIPSRYIVTLGEHDMIPTEALTEMTGTWIGFRIMSKKGYARAYSDGKYYHKPIKCAVRIAFVGPQAEDLADQTLLWDDRADVQQLFEHYNAQVNYTSREVTTMVVRNEGFNDSCSWSIDLTMQTEYLVATDAVQWLQALPEEVD